MRLSLFIAKRIYTDKGDKRKVSRPVIHIATAGVAIGLAVMIVSVCVVLGFKHTIRDKVIGFGTHITVAGFKSLQGMGQNPVVIGDSMMHVLNGINGVKHVQRYAIKQGILKTDSDFLGVMFKGVAEEYDTLFLHENMIDGYIPEFSSKSTEHKIVVSANMASKLNLKTGDKVFAYFIDDNNLRARRLYISGIYQTNMSQFDKNIIFTDMYSAIKLNGWEKDQVSGAELTVNDFNNIYITEDTLINKVNRTSDRNGEIFSSETIRESYPQIFSWLDLLDLNVWIIMALMICVAGFTMISGLLIIILERAGMIGILKALGARNNTIRHTFLWFAVFIISKGLLWGNIIGLGIVILQNFTGIITLDPATYYVREVPVEVNIPIILLINIATLIISVFVLIAPSYLISHIHPAKSMRYE